jgi:Glyoxalase-like domain
MSGLQVIPCQSDDQRSIFSPPHLALRRAAMCLRHIAGCDQRRLTVIHLAPVGTQLPAYRDAVPNIHLGSIALDCAGPLPLATFWADLLGGEVAFTSDAFVAVKTDHTWLAATRVEDYVPPSWPESRMPKQMHLDLAVDDLKGAEQRATALGVVRAKSQPAPERYVVLFDPTGHPFCLSVQIPE